MKQPLHHSKIRVIKGDITTASVDAVVNAANADLIPGGGVDRAIHLAAGPLLVKAVREHQRCETGRAVLTPGFNLKAKWVIHAVGPIWNERETITKRSRLLRETYQSIFALAIKHQFLSIAIPNISTGVFRFPKPLAAKIAIEETTLCLKTNRNMKIIAFYCFEEDNYQIYQDLLANP